LDISSPKTLLILTGLFATTLGLALLLLAKRDDAPSLDVPLISGLGKRILGGSLLLAAIVSFATALMYPKF
jgi:hypothetical protein